MENFINESKRRKLDRPITGVIQSDRIWEQWYSKDAMNSKLPKMTQEDYLYSCIGDDPNRIIINNRGQKEFTVDAFQKYSNQFKAAFAASKLQIGDVICTIGLTTPELYAIKYAATSLGLITCNLNVLDMGVTDFGKNRLFTQMKNVNPKMIFTLDLIEDKVSLVVNDEQFKNAIKVRMPLEKSTKIYNPERAILTMKHVKDVLSGKSVNSSINLNDFLSMGKLVNLEDIKNVYEEGLPCNIAFTSGTTGINKAVLLSHDANNALAFQQKIADFGFEVGSKHLAVLPPFLAFWDADVVHVTLCLGASNILELSPKPEDIMKYFKKYKGINMGIWPQYMWSELLKLPEKDLKRISEDLKIAIVGGERCEVNAAETFYNKTGVVQLTGYGASEVNTTFSVTHPDCDKVGSCGLPLPFNNLKIVDDSFNDLTYNKPGRLLITSPALMNGYYNRPDLTEKVLYTDKGGVTWYNTGDYAVLDDDGCLTVLDRYSKPIVIKSNNKEEKVNLLDVAEVIKSNRNVKICKLTYNNNRIVLHLVVDNFLGLSQEEAVNDIINTIKEKLPEIYWPNYIRILNEMPRTSVGKVNYPKLEECANLITENCFEDNKFNIILEENLTLSRSK